MMWPDRRRTMDSITALMQRKVPRRFAAITSSNSARLVSRSDLKYVTPALFTRTSTRPHLLRISFAAALTLRSDETSQTYAAAHPPFLVICLTKEVSRRLSRDVTTTRAPIRAKAFATSYPIPRLAPVTQTTGWFRRPFGLFLVNLMIVCSRLT